MLGCTGVESYSIMALALSDKRAQQNCESMRRMFQALEAGRGRHLYSVVKPHFDRCFFCQTWAITHEINYKKTFKKFRGND